MSVVLLRASIKIIRGGWLGRPDDAQAEHQSALSAWIIESRAEVMKDRTRAGLADVLHEAVC
jgi:hypothetical protein